MNEYIQLLQSLIQTQSFSGEEQGTANLLSEFLRAKGISFQQQDNNIWAKNKYYDESKPTILLNSHHDTVKPNKAYTRDPFDGAIVDGTLYGLGSNDAGGCLVSLIATFCHFYHQENLKYNLLLAATAEEENSGDKGIRSILNLLPKIDFAIVGEPTQMNMAIAEKGLLVIDAKAKGVSGHAAHYNTVNPILVALRDIQKLEPYKFEKVSEQLGEVKVSVTQINAGAQHNVVPAECSYVIDCRVTEQYTLQEVFEQLNTITESELKPRSFKNNSSGIDENHPIVQAGKAMGKSVYGSPTLSDQAALSCPSLKMGPGDSTRSHQANEFIHIHEIENGIKDYIKLLTTIL